MLRDVRKLAVFILAGIGACSCIQACESDSIRFVPQLPTDVRLEGESTVGRWSCAGSDIVAIFEADLNAEELRTIARRYLQAGKMPDADPVKANGGEVRVYVEIRPKLLDCGNPRMERDLQRAVRACEYPVISYWFNKVEGPIRSVSDDAAAIEMEVEGTLVIADTPRRIKHTARVRILDIDEFQVSGRLSLKMTDFDISPPRALLGLIRAHDRFDVVYAFTIRPKDRPLETQTHKE